jgi:hypothetical protein
MICNLIKYLKIALDVIVLKQNSKQLDFWYAQEMSTGYIIMFLGSKVQPVRRAENFTTIFEPIV